MTIHRLPKHATPCYLACTALVHTAPQYLHRTCAHCSSIFAPHLCTQLLNICTALVHTAQYFHRTCAHCSSIFSPHLCTLLLSICTALVHIAPEYFHCTCAHYYWTVPSSPSALDRMFKSKHSSRRQVLSSITCWLWLLCWEEATTHLHANKTLTVNA